MFDFDRPVHPALRERLRTHKFFFQKEHTSDKRQINRSRPKNKNPTFFEPCRE